MSQQDPLLRMDNLSVHFEQESSGFAMFSEPDTVRAVDSVSLDIYENDIVAIVGESGCGKTTLGKAAIGSTRPTDGSVHYRGQDIWDSKDKRGNIDIPFKNIRRALQMIHQDPGSSLNPNQRVIRTLAEPLMTWYKDLDSNDRQARIHAMLERTGMSPPEDYAQRYPHQLSGGEKQRVALIRVLLMNPDLILADEAISALDVSLRVNMMDLMIELQAEFNTSYLFISHDLSNAKYLAEKADGRIGVMYLGELVEIGPVEQIINNPQHPYTKVLMWATPSIDPRIEEDPEPPVRQIDIPDPVNPPSGCRFHTRCPEAREHCKSHSPDSTTKEAQHTVSCFHAEDNEEYWDSPELEE